MEKKWYKVTFYASMTDDDVRAMKNCFFNAMDEAMQIDNCSGLDIELDDEENEEEVDFDICLAEDDYVYNYSTGAIQIDKSVFDDFILGSIIRIKFSDEDDIIMEYQMVDEDDDFIYCDFFGDCK